MISLNIFGKLMILMRLAGFPTVAGSSGERKGWAQELKFDEAPHPRGGEWIIRTSSPSTWRGVCTRYQQVQWVISRNYSSDGQNKKCETILKSLNVGTSFLFTFENLTALTEDLVPFYWCVIGPHSWWWGISLSAKVFQLQWDCLIADEWVLRCSVSAS